MPVTVVSGFLGSGKTTLINRILAEEHGHAIGVIVNDVGAIDVDAALMRESGDDIISLRNGCVCCSIQGDLIAQVARLANSQELDHIIIEASGVSEPGNIVRALKYPQLHNSVYASAVVALIDVELFPELQGKARYLANEQLAAADVVLLNKVDLVSLEQLAVVAKDCACPGLPTIECRHADVPLEIIFSAAHANNHQHGMSSTIELFESAVWRPGGLVNLEELRCRLRSISKNMIRIKGFVQAEDTGDNWLIQVVGRRANFVKVMDKQPSALVLIGLQGDVDWALCIENLDASVASGLEVSASDPVRHFSTREIRD